MNKSIIKLFLLGGLAITSITSCTDNYMDYNKNPYEVTDDEMERDAHKLGAALVGMQSVIVPVGEHLAQFSECLLGGVFSGYMADSKTWGNSFSYFNQSEDWNGKVYLDIMPEIYSNLAEVKKVTTDPIPLAVAEILKVTAIVRVTDVYGPIPYSKFGTGIQVAYDSQKDVYYRFFEELSNAIEVLTSYNSRTSEPYLEDYDYIYNGNVANWIKFANTLRLRLAMRISYVDQTKALDEAKAAIDHTIGLMTSVSDNAVLKQSVSFSFINEWWEAFESFNDFRMSATMDCYLKGLQDPRLASYFKVAKKDGAYHGVRNGQTSRSQGTLSEAASSMNVGQASSILWMDAAETYFLLAEAKLRLNLGDKTVKEYYEEGVKTSFSSKGASGAESYLDNDVNVPSTSFIDPTNGRNTDVSRMVSTLTVKWDESASPDKKLERIMVQKWIALFPDGQEAWSEMRRTGYPGIVTINTNASGGEVATGELISRLKFPTKEYSDNGENTQAAVSLLKGTDIAGTRLWWDVKR